MNLNHDQILALDKYYRINLINQVSGLRSVNLIGTQNVEKETNLAIFNSVTHIGANPPCLGFIMRPLSVKRDTYDNILATQYYTVNQVPSNLVLAAHHTSAKYPSNVSEFDKTNLTAEYIDNFPAPFVKESQIKIGLSFKEEHTIKINGTRLIVGQIEKLIIADGAVEETGHIDHELLDSVTVAGLDAYYTCKKLRKETYARPR